ncbi:MAG: AI-2E family transporter [Pedosphaera sp.]|nr:AI-2E family transporter [Pedosphaera sp.]MST01241.1 AI-2E family transporter [Pedosphaera sp.]
MSFPPPTEKQARVLWFSLTALAVGAALALLGTVLWGVGMVVNKLSPVLIPLAVAGILAYLLDPLVDFFERRMSRAAAILAVFSLALLFFGLLLGTVIPRLVVETGDLAQRAPGLVEKVQKSVSEWLATSPWAAKGKLAWDQQGADMTDWFVSSLPKATTWLLARLGQAASWFGLLAGFALVPVYVFYFLLEKKRIEGGWANYLPLAAGPVRDEAAFILRSINDCLITFFRGQILVALCDAALLTLGLWAVGVEFALFLGFVAGILCIVPYLGVMVALVPALALTAVQFQDWQHPAAVLAIFAVVLKLDSWYLSPKIIGDRVGLHPLAIIVSVIAGTCLLGGLLGGLLAIPLAAALRTLLAHYVWKRPTNAAAS